MLLQPAGMLITFAAFVKLLQVDFKIPFECFVVEQTETLGLIANLFFYSIELILCHLFCCRPFIFSCIVFLMLMLELLIAYSSIYRHNEFYLIDNRCATLIVFEPQSPLIACLRESSICEQINLLPKRFA